MKKASKQSPAFAKPNVGKEKAEMMSRLLTTPTIPVPERYYYSKNKHLMYQKLQAIAPVEHQPNPTLTRSSSNMKRRAMKRN